MATLEEDFPRGGTAKRPTENKIAVQRGEVDNLFQVQLDTRFIKPVKCWAGLCHNITVCTLRSPKFVNRSCSDVFSLS